MIYIFIIHNAYVKGRDDDVWLITRCHIKMRSRAGLGPQASRLTTQTPFNHKYRGLFATQRAKSNMSTLAQMTLSKELISVIGCIDEGNETQTLGF